MVCQLRKVKLVQSQPASLQASVVTSDAIFVEHRALRGILLVYHSAARCGGGRLRTLGGDGRDRHKYQEGADENPLGHAIFPCEKTLFHQRGAILGRVFRAVNLRIRV
jgi:hypothetical protein